MLYTAEIYLVNLDCLPWAKILRAAIGFEFCHNRISLGAQFTLTSNNLSDLGIKGDDIYLLGRVLRLNVGRH